MAEYELTSAPFLGGYSRDIAGTRLVEITDLSLLSIAQPLGGRDALQKAVQATWGCDLPPLGKSALSADNLTRLICLGPDAFMALSATDLGGIGAVFGDSGYITDQTDNWLILRLSGPLAIAALERICPVDLDADAMPPGRFARTVMEHLGAIVIRQDATEFLLLSASSSAGSFLHAVETSLDYVL